MNKKPYLIILILLVLTTLVLGFISYRSLRPAKTVDKVIKDEYTQPVNPTEYQKTIFKELQSITDVASTEFGKSLAINFATDFLNLSNKKLSTDVGGLQFFALELREDFHKKMKVEYYQYIPLYISKGLVLPTVSEVVVINEYQAENGAFIYDLGITYSNEEDLQSDIIKELTVKVAPTPNGKLIVVEVYSTIN